MLPTLVAARTVNEHHRFCIIGNSNFEFTECQQFCRILTCGSQLAEILFFRTVFGGSCSCHQSHHLNCIKPSSSPHHD